MMKNDVGVCPGCDMPLADNGGCFYPYCSDPAKPRTPAPAGEIGELVERLRREELAEDDPKQRSMYLVNPDGPAAADLITTQQSTIAEALARIAKFEEVERGNDGGALIWRFTATAFDDGTVNCEWHDEPGSEVHWNKSYEAKQWVKSQIDEMVLNPQKCPYVPNASPPGPPPVVTRQNSRCWRRSSKGGATCESCSA